MKNIRPFSQSSIIIVTKNRSVLLEKCLASLSKQRYSPLEVVVVDNNSTDRTKTVISAYKTSLPLRAYKTAESGYPSIYNFGISHAKGDWIIFFDDDCIATEHWSVAMNKAIKDAPSSAIQGKIISIPAGNIYADIMGDHYQNWVTSHMIGENTMRTFDNKNLCVPARIIQSFGGFDPRLVYGSEDIELGIRYRTRGVAIVHNPGVIAYHQERATLRGFLNQHARIARSESLLDSLLPAEEKQSVLKSRKLYLHAKSAVRREVLYFRSGKPLLFLYLPVLYGMLVIVRFWTYYTSTWNPKKSES